MDNTPRVIPPVYFLGSLFLMVALHRWLPVGRVIEPPASWAGLGPLILGMLLIVSGSALFRRAGTPLRPGTPATALVQSGAFRFTRNPMYLGFVAMLIGIGILLGTLSPLLVPPLFLAVIQVIFVRREERWMEQTFGETYLSYKRRTRRWI